MKRANLQVEMLPIEALTEYENNARTHGREDIEAIEWSIQQFGFNDPIGIWSKDNVIVEGHGRLKAAKNLGMTEVPCIRLDHMTDEQRRAYGLAHNKTAELSKWDFEKLDLELAGIHELDMSKLNFKSLEEISADVWFENRKEFDNENDAEQSEEYNEFLDKFEAKKTTDDCYTPELIYDAVADWVIEEYGVDRKEFVRPFYPGGGLHKIQIC